MKIAKIVKNALPKSVLTVFGIVLIVNVQLNVANAGIDLTHWGFAEDSAQSVLYKLNVFAVKMDGKFNGDQIPLEDLYSELVRICKNRCDGSSDQIVGHTDRSDTVNRINDEVYQKWIISLAWLRRGNLEIAMKEHNLAKQNLENIKNVGATVYAGSIPIRR